MQGKFGLFKDAVEVVELRIAADKLEQLGTFSGVQEILITMDQVQILRQVCSNKLGRTVGYHALHLLWTKFQISI